MDWQVITARYHSWCMWCEKEVIMWVDKVWWKDADTRIAHLDCGAAKNRKSKEDVQR